MVWHHHVLVSDLLVYLYAFKHVDASLVGEDLHEIEFVSSDVAEVQVEYLAAGTKPSDYVEYLLARVVEHL